MNLSDRMKMYEAQEAGRRFMPLVPIFARLDGKNFSRFTQGLKRPYDERLTKMMVATATYLLEQTNALLAYTQSDEITLVWHSTDLKSQIAFDGRVQKMNSVLASMATATFNAILARHLPEKAGRMPLFDCRVWTVPNREEAANVFLWREQDATRNSIQMAGRAVFPHSRVQGKSCSEIKDMLLNEKGINWNDYLPEFKRGSYIQKRRVVRPFSADELEKLPLKHAARRNPDLAVERWETRVLDMPPFSRVANREDVIFTGADPILWAVGSSEGEAGVDPAADEVRSAG